MADREIKLIFTAEGLEQIAQSLRGFQGATGGGNAPASGSPVSAPSVNSAGIPQPAPGSGLAAAQAASARGANQAIPGGYKINPVTGGYQVVSPVGNSLGTFSQEEAYGIVSTITGQVVQPPSAGMASASMRLPYGFNPYKVKQTAGGHWGVFDPTGNQVASGLTPQGAYQTAQSMRAQAFTGQIPVPMVPNSLPPPSPSTAEQLLGFAMKAGLFATGANFVGSSIGGYYGGEAFYKEKALAGALGYIPGVGQAFQGLLAAQTEGTIAAMAQQLTYGGLTIYGGMSGLMGGQYLPQESRFFSRAALSGLIGSYSTGTLPTYEDTAAGRYYRSGGGRPAAIFNRVRDRLGGQSSPLYREMAGQYFTESINAAQDPLMVQRFSNDGLDNPDALIGTALYRNPFSSLGTLDATSRFYALDAMKQQARANIFGAQAQTYLAQSGYSLRMGAYRHAQWENDAARMSLGFQAGRLENKLSDMAGLGLSGTDEYAQLEESIKRLRIQIKEMAADFTATASSLQLAAVQTRGVERTTAAQIGLMSGVGGAGAATLTAGMIGAAASNVTAAQKRIQILRQAGFGEDSGEMLNARQALQSMLMTQAQTELNAATAPLSARSRMAGDTLSTALEIGTKTFAGYADIRGLLESQMGNVSAQLGQVSAYWSRYTQTLAGQGKKPSEEEVYRHQAQINDLVRQAAGFQMQLEEGWLDRLISQTFNAPGNFNLVASGFTRREASLFYGVQSRAFGGSGFMSDAWRREYPKRYMSAIGRTGSPQGFMETAGAMAQGANATVTLNINVKDADGSKQSSTHQVALRNDSAMFDNHVIEIKLHGASRQ